MELVVVVVEVEVGGGGGSVGCFLLRVQSVKQVRVLKWGDNPNKQQQRQQQQQQQHTKTIARKCI